MLLSGAIDPAVDAPVPQVRAKTKGVADLVFVVDVSGSMAPCIDALRKNIEAFIDSLSRGDGNNVAPVRDWRGKVVGYRDIESAEATAMLGEAHREVLVALRRLPARQREAVVLRYYLDMTEAQAAQAMGVSRGTVKSATSRGIAALARILKEEP